MQRRQETPLRRFDIAATNAPGYTKCDDRGQSEAFFDFNTGVIVYGMTAVTAAMFLAWEKIYLDWHANPPFPQIGVDQPAFRRAVWESSVSCYVLGPEYNYRSIFLGRLVGRAKIIHGRSTNYEKLAAYLNAQDGVRTFLQFPPDWKW